MRRHLLNLAILSAFVLPTALRADKDPADPTKSNAPVELKLVAKKDAYNLTAAAEDIKKDLKAAETSGKYPPAPAVDLVLEIRNKSDKEVKVWIGGDPVVLNLKLEGKGAVSVTARRFFTREFRLPRPMTIAAGKSYEMPITKLEFGFRGSSQIAYWTEAGEYELSASLNTAVSPAPEGSKVADDGFGRMSLASNKVKIKVDEKK